MAESRCLRSFCGGGAWFSYMSYSMPVYGSTCTPTNTASTPSPMPKTPSFQRLESLEVELGCVLMKARCALWMP